MIRIMVVDDEPIVRLAIKSLVNWEENGFDLRYEAANGRQALKLLEEDPETDIIVTDINMPLMNGLELIAEVRNSGFTPTIVVLSAYNDYNLVRQAFKLGVSDYILKTEMEPEGILSLLKDIAARMQERKAFLNNGRVLKADIGFLKERLLADLTKNTSLEGVEARIAELGMRIHRNNIVVCFLWVDDYQTVSKRYEDSTLNSFIISVKNAILQVMNETGNGELISLSPQEYAICLSFQGVSASSVRSRLNEILGQIRHSLSNYVNISVSIGVSSVKNGFGRISELYGQAEANARYRIILGKGRIIYPEDVSRISNSTKEGIIGKESPLIDALKEVDEVKAIKEVERLFEVIKKSAYGGIERVFSIYMELIFIMIKFLNDIGEDTQNVFGKEIDFYEKIRKFETIEEINIWIKNITLWIVNYLKEKKDVKVNRAIVRAREFIRNNYNSELSLGMVSEYVGLSESHFSSLFAKSVGMPFINYLNHYRIEKAKELMTSTNLKIYEIASTVGYSNVEHFSRIFKRVTGQSPNSYRP